MQAHRGDEVGIAQHQRLGARDARVGRPGGEGDRDHGVLDARSQRGHEGEREDQPREREEDVGDAHQRGVDPAAGIARRGADQQADRPDGDDHQQHHEQRDARAMHDAAEDVAAQGIRAEEMRRGRRE